MKTASTEQSFTTESVKSNQQYYFTESVWLENSEAIMSLRQKVFVVEQHLGDEFVYDNEEAISQHLLVWYRPDGPHRQELVACGRLTPKGRIGRIAVSMQHRGKGLGTLLLRHLIELAKNSGIKRLSLNAEMDHQQFYLGQQFTKDGPVFMKQGVPHQRLKRLIARHGA